MSVLIGNGVTTIDDSAFEHCLALKDIFIPGNVTSIGRYAFSNCDNLENITVDINNKHYSSDEYGVLFNKDKSILLQYPIGNTRTSYTIPNSVSSIGDSAFQNAKYIADITIPDNVTSIGHAVFLGTAYYKEPSNWKEGALYIDKHLVEVNSISSETFTIKSGTLTISIFAFRDTCNPTSIIIPDSIVSIGYGVSRYFTKLSDVYYGGTRLQWLKINIASDNYKLNSATRHYHFEKPHTYNAIIINPTCTTQGYTTYTCECGDTYVADYVDVSHTWSEWEAVSDLQYTRSCILCDAKENAGKLQMGEIKLVVSTNGTSSYLDWEDVPGATGYVIYALQESWLVKIDTKNESCYMISSNYSTYSVRAYAELGTQIHYGGRSEVNLSCTGHIYNSTDILPTCSYYGYTYYECACGSYYRDGFVECLPHTFTDYISDGKATCITDGSLIAKCDNCNATDTKPEKGTHKFSDSFIIDLAPTCTTVGQKSRHCVYCTEKTDITPIGKLAHSYNTITIDSTCTDRGYKIYTCPCGESYAETLPALGHNFSGSVCTTCGYDKADDCTCNCHKTGLSALIWKILNFFYRLLRLNPTCNCGIAHY